MGKGPTDGGHTGTEKRSTRRSTQTDTPGPAAATPTWNNTGPGWTGGGPDTPATDEAAGRRAPAWGGRGRFVIPFGAVCYPFCISAYQRCIRNPDTSLLYQKKYVVSAMYQRCISNQENHPDTPLIRS